MLQDETFTPLPVANAASFRKPPTVVNEKVEHKERAKVGTREARKRRMLSKGTGRLVVQVEVAPSPKAYEACICDRAPVFHTFDCPVNDVFRR